MPTHRYNALHNLGQIARNVVDIQRVVDLLTSSTVPSFMVELLGVVKLTMKTTVLGVDAPSLVAMFRKGSQESKEYLCGD